MSRLSIQVLRGSDAGQLLQPAGDVIRIGRAPSNELCLNENHVSGEHARISIGQERVTLEDLHSTNGTIIARGEERIELDESRGLVAELETGDQIELGGGGGAEAVTLGITLGEEAEPAHVMAVRPLNQLGQGVQNDERSRDALKALAVTQRGLGGAEGLDDVLVELADAALSLIPRATHVTVVLRDSDESTKEDSYVPILTRVRVPEGARTAPEGPVPITRSVYRKVVRERAAVLAADAPTEAFSSESLLGAGIRSTIGVPLWRGEDILGVLQVDNRDAPAMFDETDVDCLGVLAANASLAVANARLIRRLVAAEKRLEKENSYLRHQAAKSSGSLEIIGESKAMSALFEQLAKVVDTRVTVLVEGETGAGKELIASAVHHRSRRRDKMFVAQNCAAMPENLLESELFGHKRGAFTGATDEKKGLFEIADGGTLFLDEVTEMPRSLQAKLLRVLQEGEIRPVGATSTMIVDVRIVAATNREMEKEVEAGNFREDLYYRLKVFPIRVPPLRERRDDVPLLAGFFLKRYAREIGKNLVSFSQIASELLMAYDWPGNVRELQNEIQRIVIQADEEEIVGPELLSSRVRKVEAIVAKAGVEKGSLKQMLEQVEKHFLLEALRDHGNNKTSTAKTLGITREGLHKKLRHLKLN